jgi:hypothetical protein
LAEYAHEASVAEIGDPELMAAEEQSGSWRHKRRAFEGDNKAPCNPDPERNINKN